MLFVLTFSNYVLVFPSEILSLHFELPMWYSMYHNYLKSLTFFFLLNPDENH